MREGLLLFSLRLKYVQEDFIHGDITQFEN